MTEPPLNQVPEAAYLRAVLAAAPRFIAVIDATGTVLWAGGDSESMVGIPAPELIGRNLLDFVPPSELPLALESMAYAVRIDRPFRAMEFRYLHADGSIGVAEAVSANRLNDPVIQGVVLQVHDVTERSVTDQVLESIAAGGPVSTMLRLVARLVETRLPECRAIVAIDPVEGHFAVAASALDALDHLTVAGADSSPAVPLDLTESAERHHPAAVGTGHRGRPSAHPPRPRVVAPGHAGRGPRPGLRRLLGVPRVPAVERGHRRVHHRLAARTR